MLTIVKAEMSPQLCIYIYKCILCCILVTVNFVIVEFIRFENIQLCSNQSFPLDICIILSHSQYV